MSRLSFVAVLCFASVAFSSTFLKGNTPTVFLEMQELEKSSFGKNLLDTVALQIKNQAPLADVSKLLSDLKKDLQKQQAEADALQAERREDCKKTIAAFNKRIEFANSEIRDATNQISQLEKTVAALKTKINNLEVELSNYQKQKADAIAAREQAAKEFALRVEEHKIRINVLEDIIERLREAGNVPEADQTAILLELAKLGKQNPIAAFAQVAITLPQEQWENVINKLEEIKNSLEKSRDDDNAQEERNIENHEKFLVHINGAIKTTSTNLKNTRIELSENEAALANQRTRLANNQKELKQATEGKNAKEAECERWETQYAEDSKQRSNEISVVEKVQEIFARRIASAKDYLKERIDQE